MDLEEFWASVPEAAGWKPTEKIKLFGWFLHTHQGKSNFSAPDVKACFTKLGIDGPKSAGPFLDSLAKRRPRVVLKESAGYRLELSVKQAFDAQYGQRKAAIQVHKLLTDLPGKLSAAADKAFLEEALTCFKHSAFRASIVMAWNLAYDHLCLWILAEPARLSAFNAALNSKYAKLHPTPFTKRDDFTDAQEFRVIDACNDANIIGTPLFKVLKAKLEKRNLSAHPSGITVSEPVAEEFIKDLVDNVVLKLPL